MVNQWSTVSIVSTVASACISLEVIKFVRESSKVAQSLTAHWGGLALVGTMQVDGVVVL